MDFQETLPLALGLVIFSFIITSLLVVPWINLLYKLKLTRRKEASKNKHHLFDKFHDKKAGTPVGGGVLLVIVVTLLFAFIFSISSHMGVYIRSAHNFGWELFVIFFTFISFGVLGFVDDHVKIFGKPQQGVTRLQFGLTRKVKFMLQWVLAVIVALVLYGEMGIQILHIPILNVTINMGWWYIPFAASVIVSFANAYNFTDGMDGLAAGLLMICIIAFGFIAAGNLDTPLIVFIAIWLGALIAFLYFNVWPARIFMGDAGSLSFGAMLAVAGLLTGNIIALVVIGGIFVVEAVSSAVQILGRRFLGRKILPLAPLHNTFLVMGWEEPKIVTRAWLAGIILAIFGLWLATI